MFAVIARLLRVLFIYFKTCFEKLATPVERFVAETKFKIVQITSNTRAVMHEMFMLPTLLRH